MTGPRVSLRAEEHVAEPVFHFVLESEGYIGYFRLYEKSRTDTDLRRKEEERGPLTL